jgi:tetratricopeptide (TPR) repeat protein
MWWQSIAYRELGLWEQANTAIDESLLLYPTLGRIHVVKALICADQGRHVEARKHIETARRLGSDLTLTERLWRRVWFNSPKLEADIAIIHALYAATESSA